MATDLVEPLSRASLKLSPREIGILLKFTANGTHPGCVNGAMLRLKLQPLR